MYRLQPLRRDVAKEEELDGKGEAEVKEHDTDSHELSRLCIRTVDDRQEVPKQKGTRQDEPDDDCDPAQPIARCREPQKFERTDAHERHGDPRRIGVPVETQDFQERGLASVPPKQSPCHERDEKGVAVDEGCSKSQGRELVGVRCAAAVRREVPNNSGGEVQDRHDSCREPDGSVQVRVSIHRLKEVLHRV